MGHGSSRSLAGSGSDSDDEVASSESSSRGRFRRKLRLYRRTSNQHSHRKQLADGDFTGIVCVELIGAEMESKDKWFACLSLGERTYRTPKSEHTDKPIWNSKKKVVLEKGGAHIARISLYRTTSLSRNNLVGYCETNLSPFYDKEEYSTKDTFNLLDPSTSSKVVGSITVHIFMENYNEIKKSFARRVLAIVDYNNDGKLQFSEFSELMDVFGNQHAVSKKKEFFKKVDTNGDGVVSMDELATLLASSNEKEPLISSCPVCGENLLNFDELNAVIHLTLCFDEGTGNQIMTGGFLTEKQASHSWMFNLSEWINFTSYDVGLNSGSNASHIVVFDRRSKRLVEELIDRKIVMSMRAIYQSRVGLTLMEKGAKDFLQSLSEKQGRKMDSPESAKNIPKFVDIFKDQINLDEIKLPLESFKTFNEFFVRELKPDARKIDFKQNDDIAVCAADSRLMAFKTINDGLRLWIKGRKFSVKGLLNEAESHGRFESGSLVIFRLAPQDYHRFHFPVSGTIEQFFEIPGCLYTVNPIAVNSKYCNVFTENKRTVHIISTADFGKVAFVSIGATMVGSIRFLKDKGDRVEKGDEFGYFSFGGSTVICVFEENAINFDQDLLANSERSLETLVSVGMTLGVSRKM